MARSGVLVLDLARTVDPSPLSTDPLLDTRVVGSFTDAVNVSADARPDVIVVLFGRSTPEEEHQVRALSHRTNGLLLVTEPADERRISQLLKAGASGWLFTADAKSRLPAAVHELLRGGIPMSAAAARVVLQRARRSSSQMAAVRPGDAANGALLSDRQLDVLRLLARSQSYDEIGVELGMSVNTVRTHVRAIYDRLGASTKVEAVLIARELGLLPKGDMP